MKKLLSILAASSLIITMPLAVVSCKKPDVAERFDYSNLINTFVAETIVIFQTEIYEAFKPWNNISEKQLPETMTLEEIIAHEDDFNDHSSIYYKKVSNEIYKIINIGEINKSINKEITSNINYQPILIDKASPLKNGITIENISPVVKGKNCTLNIEMSADIFYKDSNGNNDFQKTTTFAFINIFESPDILGAAKLIGDRYNDIINGTQANDYSFIGDKGDLDNTAEDLQKNSDVLSFVSKKIAAISTEDISSSLNPSIVYNETKVNVNKTSFSDAGRFESIFGNQNASITPFTQYKTALKALSGDRASEELFLSNIKTNNPEKSWLFSHVSAFNDQYTENAVAASKRDPSIALAINPYNLDYNFANDGSAIKWALERQGSKFALNMENDKKTIALFGVDVSGAAYYLEGQKYDLPEQKIVYRQVTSYSSTSDLYKKFIDDAYQYQKAFVGLKGRALDENPQYQHFYLKKIEGIFSWELYKELNWEQYGEDLMAANPEANEYSKDLQFTSMFTNKYILTGAGEDTPEAKQPNKVYFKIPVYPNPKEECVFLMSNKKNGYMDGFVLKSYLFSSGAKNQFKPSFSFRSEFDFLYDSKYSYISNDSQRYLHLWNERSMFKLI
ncbi:hypothetical protein [Spiroplasma alleghenense]|uniref:Lipoprotein n=1 Tax=Spiroplasma alleghenense TaxID=216931 RepID=A0A345Z566_9MOLU|nr:hypothetical protein [Spiroplasma alleghenense]AXK51745.1 hypothetical protein SALLE_v1c10750 [Spiroplasma alleghenense]